ncbi:MAG: ArsR family transcriptional regulator [Chloroflexi bacterium]|nr:ArsR family transcriptional regulator [Chloroflexota bacterium]
MQRTRRQILDSIKLSGPMSVDQLGEILEVMPVTVRAHVNVLERDRLLKGSEHRTGRAGRPSILYSLTDEAQDLFPKDYDGLASNILDNVRKLHGDRCVTQVIERIGEEMAQANADKFRARDMASKVEQASRVMNQNGSLATWEKQGDKYILTAHNCPYLHVAEHSPGICGMETAFLRKALSAEVTLESSVINGAHDCKFFIQGN